MTEKEYSHDPHIWPSWVNYPPMTADEINAFVIIGNLILERLEDTDFWVTAPPKPKPEPEGSDDIPDGA